MLSKKTLALLAATGAVLGTYALVRSGKRGGLFRTSGSFQKGQFVTVRTNAPIYDSAGAVHYAPAGAIFIVLSKGPNAQGVPDMWKLSDPANPASAPVYASDADVTPWSPMATSGNFSKGQFVTVRSGASVYDAAGNMHAAAPGGIYLVLSKAAASGGRDLWKLTDAANPASPPIYADDADVSVWSPIATSGEFQFDPEHIVVDYQNPADRVTDMRPERIYYELPYQIVCPEDGSLPFEVDATGQPTGRQVVMPGESPTVGTPGEYVLVAGEAVGATAIERMRGGAAWRGAGYRGANWRGGFGVRGEGDYAVGRMYVTPPHTPLNRFQPLGGLGGGLFRERALLAAERRRMMMAQWRAQQAAMAAQAQAAMAAETAAAQTAADAAAAAAAQASTADLGSDAGDDLSSDPGTGG